jgi:hypothetical protein
MSTAQYVIGGLNVAFKVRLYSSPSRTTRAASDPGVDHPQIPLSLGQNHQNDLSALKTGSFGREFVGGVVCEFGEHPRSRSGGRLPSMAWALTTVPVQAVKSLIVLRNDPAVRDALGHDELLPAPTLLHEARAGEPRPLADKDVFQRSSSTNDPFELDTPAPRAVPPMPSASP